MQIEEAGKQQILPNYLTFQDRAGGYYEIEYGVMKGGGAGAPAQGSDRDIRFLEGRPVHDGLPLPRGIMEGRQGDAVGASPHFFVP